jgi:hypothetical protein
LTFAISVEAVAKEKRKKITKNDLMENELGLPSPNPGLSTRRMTELLCL